MGSRPPDDETLPIDLPCECARVLASQFTSRVVRSLTHVALACVSCITCHTGMMTAFLQMCGGCKRRMVHRLRARERQRCDSSGGGCNFLEDMSKSKNVGIERIRFFDSDIVFYFSCSWNACSICRTQLEAGRRIGLLLPRSLLVAVAAFVGNGCGSHLTPSKPRQFEPHSTHACLRAGTGHVKVNL